MATVKTTKNGHHKLLKKSFDYILKKEKTSEGSLASAMNTSVTHALNQFRALHTIYPEHKHKGEKILSHHYIQSFKPGEVDAKQAHKLGQEFAYKAFGPDAVVVVATHTDRGHIHNHFYVCSVKLDGSRIVDNGRSLKRIRGISDELCLSHGLSVVSSPSKNNSMDYKEWKERNKGSSWKEEIRMDIDRAIASSNSFESFTETLRSKGYEVNDKKKYLTLKREGYERPVRTMRLGDDYTEEAIRKRIEAPDKHSVMLPKLKTTIPFTSFAKERRRKYTSTGSQLGLSYLSVLEIIFRLIVNNSFREARKLELGKPYMLLNDYYFAMYLSSLLFFEEHNIKTRGDYAAYRKQHRQSTPRIAFIDESLDTVTKTAHPDPREDVRLGVSEKVDSNVIINTSRTR